jgi:hypothetical protein
MFSVFVEDKMSKRWGPAGWKTLHSVALLYPDNPTPADRAAMDSWLNAFQNSLVCPDCKAHFTKMLAGFRKQFDFLASRHTFFWATCKMHNMVNVRLGHPQLTLYREAFAMYKNDPTLALIRDKYYKYVTVISAREHTLDSHITTRDVELMRRAESQVFRKWGAPSWGSTTIDAFLEEDSEVEIELAAHDATRVKNAEKAAAPAAVRASVALGGPFRMKQAGVPRLLM